MNYYLTLLDRIEKAPDEESSIGLILCAEKDHLDVEVALHDIGKPIGVAEYQYLLPKEELLKIVSSEMDKIDEWKDEGSKISWTIGGQLWNVKNSK